MIKELLISFKENLESKTSNPFFGTLILIWIIKNWNLFYSIFNFDPKTPLKLKQEFITNHFKKHPFLETLGICVLKAIVFLIIAYLLINLSRLIINFFEKKVTPIMYKWTDKNSIVLRSVLDSSEEERQRLEKRLEEERAAKLKLQSDYDRLETRITDLLTKNSLLKNGETDKETAPVISLTSNKLDLILKKLKKDNMIGEFEKVAQTILNGKTMNREDEYVKEFVSLGLILNNGYASNNLYNYSLTTLGKDLSEAVLLEKLQ